MQQISATHPERHRPQGWSAIALEQNTVGITFVKDIETWHKPFIEISQPHFAFSAAGVDIHAGEAVTVLEIGVEIHPVTTQTRQSIAMPEKTRQAIELRRRIHAIEYAESLELRSSIVMPACGSREGLQV